PERPDCRQLTGPGNGQYLYQYPQQHAGRFCQHHCQQPERSAEKTVGDHHRAHRTSIGSEYLWYERAYPLCTLALCILYTGFLITCHIIGNRMVFPEEENILKLKPTATCSTFAFTAF